MDIKRDKYMIDEYGNIYIGDKKMKHFRNHDGYLRIELDTGNGRRKFFIHILVAHAFVVNENPTVNTIVEHLDNNKSNPYYLNLEWVTPEVNVQRAFEDGLIKLPTCEDRYNSILTNDQVHDICRRLESGETSNMILESMGIEVNHNSLNLISKIRKGVNYASISSQYNIGEAIRDNYTKLTPEIIHQLCVLFQDGKSFTEICEVMDWDYKSQRIKNILSRTYTKSHHKTIVNQYKW